MSVSAQQLIHIANKTPSFTHTQTHLHAHTQPQLHAPTIFLPPRRERFLYRSLPRSLCSCSVVPLYTHVLASCRSLVLSFFLSCSRRLTPSRSASGFRVTPRLLSHIRLWLPSHATASEPHPPLASESRHGFRAASICLWLLSHATGFRPPPGRATKRSS